MVKKINQQAITRTMVIAECLNLVATRISAAENAVAQAQESANAEEKSSAGDKYETGRAMSQNQRDMNQRQLLLALADKALLQRLAHLPEPAIISPGSLIKTEGGWVFVAVGLGVISINGQKVIAVSAQSPLAQAMAGKRPGDSFTLNGKTQKTEPCP